MEKCGRTPRCYEQPSFSSTLLDAVYRSMDESEGTGTEEEKRGSKGYEKYGYKRDSSGLATHRQQQKLSVRTRQEPASRRGGWAHSTSSSSDCSSYGGFSSSEAESVRLKPIRTASRPDLSRYHYPVQSPSNYSGDNKKKFTSSSVKNKLKEFRKSSSKQQMPPSSPGARLASFLNAIFAKKGSKSGGDTAGRDQASSGRRGTEERSACSTASSYTRSCLSKTPSTAKRSVRFCPISITVSDDNPTLPYSGDLHSATDGKKRVEEILRGLEREEEDDEEEEEESDSSSDLFELDDLTVGVGRRFRDELPVYGTTSLGVNKPISHVLYRPVI